MTINHIDQVAEWWENAEQITDTNLPRIGDTLIFPYNAGGYAIEIEEDGWTPDDLVPGEPVRILSRAPKPKPAWHDAIAVVAHTVGRRDRSVFIRGDDGWWEDADCSYEADELAYVTPLIEAKVTDEMVRRGSDWAMDNPMRGDEDMRLLLIAALGLETE